MSDGHAESDPAEDWSLEDLHEQPWSEIEGAYLQVNKECREDVTNLDPGEPQDSWMEEREGTLVGRAVGWGLYYDSSLGEHVRNSMGPTIYLDTPRETTLEIRTDNTSHDLLEIALPTEDIDG